MKLRTLILGSAATIMMVGGAQAADLAVASGVDGVKVCSAEGVGYFYIPGSDACLKISASIRERMGYMTPASATTGNFWSQTEASIQATSKWMSSWGASSVDVQFLEDTSEGSGATGVVLDHASANVGGLSFGFQNTTAESVGPYTDYGAMRNDHKNDNISYGMSAGGFGIKLGIEDDNSYWGNDTPEFAAAVTGGMGGLSFTLTGAVVTNRPGVGTGYGVNFGGTWGKSGGLQIAANAAWSHNAAVYVGGSDLVLGVPTDVGNWMSAFASFQAPIGGGALLQGTIAWRDGPSVAAVNDTTTHAALGVVVTLAQNVTGQIEGFWDSTGGATSEGAFVGVKASTP